MSEENEQISEESAPVQPTAETPAPEPAEPETSVEPPKAGKSRRKGRRAAPEPTVEEPPAAESEPPAAAENASEDVPGEGSEAEPVASEPSAPAEESEAVETPVAESRSRKGRKKNRPAAEPAEEQPEGESSAETESAAEAAPEGEASDAEPEAQSEEESGDQESAEPADEGVRHSLPLVVEAILFASQKPMSAKELLSVLRGAAEAAKEIPDAPARAFAKIKEPHLREAIESLEIACAAPDRAYEVRESAAGWQLVTKPQYSPWLRQLFPEHRSARLSAPALETLAIIAYRQPITRADIEAVRGVAVDGVMQTLLDRGLVKIAGRADVPGRPLLYDTTQNFMEHFGLKNLDDLPNAEELRKISLPTAEPPPAETLAATEQPASPETPAAPEAEAPPAGDSPVENEAPETPAEPGESAPAGEPASAEAVEEPVENVTSEPEPAAESEPEPESAPEPEISETPLSPEASDEESRAEN
jgi:segregation and condensation protein B